MIEDVLRNFWKYYYDSPVQLQYLIGKTYSLLPLESWLGKNFKVFKNLISETEYLSRDQLEQYQFNQLKEILNIAYNDIPFYTI